jgi:AraC-like DNA-binding protein
MSFEGSTGIIEPVFGRLGDDGFAWLKHDAQAWPNLWSASATMKGSGVLWISIAILGAVEFSLSKKMPIHPGVMIGGNSDPVKLSCRCLDPVVGGIFVSLVLAKKSLPALMGPLRGADIPKPLTRIVEGKLSKVVVVSSRELGVDLIKWAEELFSPPGPAFTHPLFFQAKALEALSLLAGVAPMKDSVSAHKRAISDQHGPAKTTLAGTSTRKEQLARERVDKAQKIITENLEEPLNLTELGRRVGCSPYYLSRTFSACAGCTLQEYQRRIRIHRAAELLRGGQHNVTEAALAVGYSSFSYFTKTFRETFGCCPGLYPVVGSRLARSDFSPHLG